MGSMMFVGLLTATFGWNVLVLKGKMVAIEDFHSLLDNILEIRRYEKNIILYGSNENDIKELSIYLHKTGENLKRLSDSISRVTGDEQFNRFKDQFLRYKTLMESSHGKLKGYNITEIRGLGSAMVSFSHDLLSKKQKRIDKALETMMVSSVIVVAGFIVFIAILFLMETKSLLARLKLLINATEDISRGNFKTIQDPAKKKDEISSLIIHFNKMVEELDSKQEQLVQSRKLASIGTFTSGIAHEINNPLNNISLTADGLLEEYDDLSEVEAKEMILEIINQTTRASEVVKNLLDFSRNDKPTFTELKVSDVIDGTIKLIKNQLMVAKIKFETIIPPGLPTINGNLYNLEQVLINLFLNAISAMPQGGAISITASQENSGYVKIDFKDNGHGISAENLERVFDPFYTTKSVGKGTGLGLSIVYGIIKKHEGYVEVKSEMNSGTTFSIYLPITKKRS